MIGRRTAEELLGEDLTDLPLIGAFSMQSAKWFKCTEFPNTQRHFFQISSD